MVSSVEQTCIPAGGLTAIVLVFSVLKRFDKPLTLFGNRFGAERVETVVAIVKNYKKYGRMTRHGPEDIQRSTRLSPFQRFWEASPQMGRGEESWAQADAWRGSTSQELVQD